ncbi:hypothetical protein K32_16520 [Kaistia sp. 32K]|nr:hypothetical protein K32_16520 [Kaistia sp. 32K]
MEDGCKPVSLRHRQAGAHKRHENRDAERTFADTSPLPQPPDFTGGRAGGRGFAPGFDSVHAAKLIVLAGIRAAPVPIHRTRDLAALISLNVRSLMEP